VLQIQSLVKCPWHLWNQQYFVLSVSFFSCEGALGGLIPSSFRSATLISTRIFSLDIARGVYSVKQPTSPFLEDSTAGSSFLLLFRLSAYNSSSYQMYVLAIARNSFRVLGRSSWTTFLMHVPAHRPFTMRYLFIDSSVPRTYTASLLNLLM